MTDLNLQFYVMNVMLLASVDSVGMARYLPCSKKVYLNELMNNSWVVIA
jgi:hypothetical protein